MPCRVSPIQFAPVAPEETYTANGLNQYTEITKNSVLRGFTYDANGNPDDPSGNAIRYTGRRWDAETGLYYYRARMYAPAIGRFLQTDPVGYVGDNVNLYGYVGNDPDNSKDPTGLIECQTKGAAAASCQAIAEKLDEIEKKVGEALDAIGEFSISAGKLVFTLSPLGDAEEIRQNIENGEYGKAALVAVLSVVTLGKGGVALKLSRKLLKFARKTLKSPLIARETESLVNQLYKGNLNPGIGTKRLKGLDNVFEARGKNGSRVYFKTDKSGKVNILAISDKNNQQQVIETLREELSNGK